MFHAQLFFMSIHWLFLPTINSWAENNLHCDEGKGCSTPALVILIPTPINITQVTALQAKGPAPHLDIKVSRNMKKVPHTTSTEFQANLVVKHKALEETRRLQNLEVLIS